MKIPEFLSKLPQDKVEHFLGGAILQSSFLLVGGPWWRGMLAVSAIAAAKELYDYLHPDKHDAEVLDWAATVAGGLAATGIITGVSAFS